MNTDYEWKWQSRLDMLIIIIFDLIHIKVIILIDKDILGLMIYCNNNESKFFFSMVSFTSLNTILMLLVSTATVKWWYSGEVFFSLFFFLKLFNK